MILRSTLFLLLSVLWQGSSLGCSCIGPNPACAVYWDTPALFLGHVSRIEHVYDQPPEEKNLITGPGQNIVHFDVIKNYRGSSSQQVVVHTSDQGSSCGFAFEEGRNYLVYASAAAGGELRTNRCSRTHQVLNAEEDPDIRWIESLTHSPAGASIFGQIRALRLNQDGGYDSTALPNIKVSISGAASREISSGADGQFHVDGIPAGKYEVTAAAPTHFSAFLPQTVTVRDRGCAEVVWSTRIDGHIRGHVFFSDGTPASGVYLTMEASGALPNDSSTWQSSYSTAGSDGSFDFAQLPPGSYVIAVNMDFAPPDGSPYYRRAFYPGTSRRSEAAVVSVGPGQTVDKLNFFLPPDSPPPAIPVSVTVIGFGGKPVPQAQIIAADDMWDSSVTSLSAATDEHGKAGIRLRAGSHYDIGAFVSLPDFTQACAEPIAVDAQGEPAPVVLVLSHHFGNCLPFKKPRSK